MSTAANSLQANGSRAGPPQAKPVLLDGGTRHALTNRDARSITIAILAMGGEGGGVLADWLVDLAEQNG